MAFWGLELSPGKPLPLVIERRLVVKQAALVIERPSAEPCMLSVGVAGGKQQYVVCRLHEGRLEHCSLELPFSPSDNATLTLKGPHKLHLTGFLDVDDEDDLAEMDEDVAASGRGRAAGGLGAIDDDDDDGVCIRSVLNISTHALVYFSGCLSTHVCLCSFLARVYRRRGR